MYASLKKKSLFDRESLQLTRRVLSIPLKEMACGNFNASLYERRLSYFLPSNVITVTFPVFLLQTKIFSLASTYIPTGFLKRPFRTDG